MTLVPKRRLQKALIRMNLLPKNITLIDTQSAQSSSQSPVNDENDTNQSKFKSIGNLVIVPKS